MPVVLSVLVLTEDSGKDAHGVQVALLKKVFGLLVPGCHTHRIHWEPQTDPARRYVVANLWKGDGPKNRRRHFRLVELHQTIATKVAEKGPEGFVVFHFDGDRTWSNRGDSENVQKFSARVVNRVGQILTGHLGERETEVALQRLLPFTPFYSVEAWLFQNTAVARKIGAELGNPKGLVAQLDAWEQAPEQIDDLLKPKDTSLLSDTYNLRMATTAWPAQQVYDLDQSFAAAVDRFRGCEALIMALNNTFSTEQAP